MWEGSILYAPSHHFFAGSHFLVRVTPFALPDPRRIRRKMPGLRDDSCHLVRISQQL